MTYDYNLLMNKAKEASKTSYSPFSKFAVGAAVLAKSGAVYTGCNVENSSFGLTICAERCAIFKAISEGEREILAVAIFLLMRMIVSLAVLAGRLCTSFREKMKLKL